MTKRIAFCKCLFLLLAFGNGEIRSEQLYYSPDLIRYKFIANNCSSIIEKQIELINNKLLTINELYNSDNWEALDELLQSIGLSGFDQALSDCSTAYKFNDGTNYFLEAHINISAIIHSVESRDKFFNKPDITNRVDNSINILNILDNAEFAIN